MDTVYKRILEVKELPCHELVRADHEGLDDAVREVDRIRHDVLNGAVVIQDDLCLRHLKSDRTPSLTHGL